MMKRVLIYGVLFWVLGCYKAAGQEAIGLYDLHYTLETDLSTPKGRNVAWDDVHVVSALQGIVNRDAPQLYVFFVDRDQLDIDKYWLNKYRRKGQWLYRKETVTYNTIEDLVSAYAGYIKGVVLYDERVPSTSNVASAVVGAEDLLPIRYDLDSESLYSRLVLGGPRLKVKRRLINEDGSVMFTGSGVILGTNRNSTGSIKNDPYIWYIENYMKTGKCNTEYAAYYLDQYWKQNPGATVRNHHTLSNHDFFISKRAFFFDLSPWGDEPATDEPTQKVGTDLATLKEMLLLAYQQNKGEKYCYIGGFPSWAFKYTKHAGGIHDDVPTEWEFLRLISAYNAFKDADAIAIGALANASFWQHFPLEERYSQPWVTHEELKQRGLLTEDGKVDVKGRNFLIFYVGDYDASSWVSQFTSLTWDDPNRGKVPMMWAISPVLQERVPHVLHNFRKTATKNDYFVASDNGAGYLSPGMLQEPRPISGLPSGLQSWAEHCKPYYEKWGLSITGFIVDGYAPGLNWEGMECYRSFSPNGIVPQKLSSWSMLFGNMPVLRADYDINDVEPKDAAVAIVNRIREREGLPFHWFRNIIKSPTWYVEVVEELKKIDDSICLLDAPSFFELLRIYLKETAPFAGGTGSREDPFLISTPQQFDHIREYRSQCFRLINDLDFSDYVREDGQSWWPLGEWGSGDNAMERFRGFFDGGGYSIRNLSVERKAHDLSIFGVTEGAEIINLKVENCSIIGEGRLGVLTGATFSTKIEQVDILDSQCENRLSDHGSNAGGLTGPLYRSVIKNCSVKGGNVYAKDCAGGISSSMSKDSEIIDCYSTCRIEGITNVGGITGKVN